MPGTATLLKPDEASEILRVSRGHVYRMVERGDLRAIRLGHGPKAHLRIPADQLELLSETPRKTAR